MRNTYVFLIASLVFIGCKNDDSAIVENSAPKTFSLLTIADKEEKVDPYPSFTWENAIDPDGDDVSYKLVLDIKESPENELTNNLQETTYKIEDKLALNTTYYWKVIAFDTKGKSTESSVFSFTTRAIQIPEAATVLNADFSGRYDHTCTVFNGKLFLIGGDKRPNKDEIWTSEDGLTWNQIPTSDRFEPRKHHAVVVFKDKLWLIGGEVEDNATNDIWNSTDGITWNKVTDSAEFSERSGFSLVSFKGKLWMHGGIKLNEDFKFETWSSEDGEHWTKEQDSNFPTRRRYDHTTLVYKDKIWIIGGYSNGLKNDVWNSTDGVNWVQLENNGSFDVRNEHTATVYDNKIWIIAGTTTGSELTNDIMYTEDGIIFTKVVSPMAFRNRAGHSTTVFNDKMLTIGGSDFGLFKNDVWFFE